MAPLERTFLLPGDIAFARKPMILSTLLGSCVSVCLHDGRQCRGGMNHYKLPRAEGGVPAGLGRGQYGDYAIPRLISMALRSGSRTEDLVASVYGGGSVLGHLGSAANLGLFNVGRRNAEVAFLCLKEAGIRVLRHDTGGTVGRKIHMNSDTNEIDVRAQEASAERMKRSEKLAEFRRRRIRVLVIDDSRTVRNILRRGIETSDDLEVVGEAADAYEARERILELDPDVLCLDIIMPRMDGVTFLQRVMRYKPIPTVIVSTMAKRGTDMRRRAQLAGAVDVIDKDELAIYGGTERLERVLVPSLRRAAATVVRPSGG